MAIERGTLRGTLSGFPFGLAENVVSGSSGSGLHTVDAPRTEESNRRRDCYVDRAISQHESRSVARSAQLSKRGISPRRKEEERSRGDKVPRLVLLLDERTCEEAAEIDQHRRAHRSGGKHDARGR